MKVRLFTACLTIAFVSAACLRGFAEASEPGVRWSAYLGGAKDEKGRGIAVDHSGNLLICGWTESSGWIAGGWDTTHNGNADGFAAKLAPSGTPIWSTYFGGGASDKARAMAIDGSGNLLLTGETRSPGWVAGDLNTTYGGGTDAFVVKLMASGTYAWSSYLGGGQEDWANGIAVDGDGYVLVTGMTASPYWVSGGWDDTYNGSGELGGDAFVVKLTPEGTHVWSSFLGGKDSECHTGGDIAVGATGNVLVTGNTRSPDWVSGGWDTVYNGGAQAGDGFLVHLNSSGGHVWSTYLGGEGSDLGRDVAIDGGGNILVTGWTTSAGWISGGWNPAYNGEGYSGQDAFAAKLTSAGAHIWSSYLGGRGFDVSHGLAVGKDGSIVVTGHTNSKGWISGGTDTAFGGNSDAYVVKLSPSGGHVWSTYLGGEEPDEGRAITLDGAGNILVTGGTFSPGWAGDGGHSTHNGGCDVFVVKIGNAAGTSWPH